ncbi:dihydrolipoamide acetyltransferase family protein [Cryobacterium sp. BB307]|uniref:dihydrolipoamide acetyltransferase family protein n=1 Tax=Cryobacterium sp. BB307 TaxID=2716317 RepID=UPI001447CFDF|nr:dihydrolipoamide acetyltransferase family protein [Cryobacterium sp. BB307]
MSEVTMPRLSDTMEEGELAKWLKNVGDPVAKGDAIAEIETDKATMELESFEDGVLEQQLVPEGAIVPIGQAVAVIGDGSSAKTPGAAPQPAEQEAAGGKETGEPSEEEPEATPEPEAEEPAGEEPERGAEEPAGEEPGEPASPEPTAAPSGKAAAGLTTGGVSRMSPLARKLARDHGIDPATIEGTGPQGRIIRADVEAAIAAAESEGAPAQQPQEPAPEAPRPQQATPTGAADAKESERVPANRIRMVAAKRLTESQQVPHFFLTAVAELDAFLEFRASINATLESQGVKVSVNDLIVRAAAVTLRRHPEANASWDGDAVLSHNRVNIGVAVATDNGLLVPVIKDADRISLSEVAQRTRALAEKARAGKLALDEMSGGTFSVSNLGMFGITQFTAMLNPPEAGILAVGAATKEPVMRDGALAEVSKLKLTLTVDHRVMDGATGAAFLADLVAVLEKPLGILL